MSENIFPPRGINRLYIGEFSLRNFPKASSPLKMKVWPGGRCGWWGGDGEVRRAMTDISR